MENVLVTVEISLENIGGDTLGGLLLEQKISQEKLHEFDVGIENAYLESDAFLHQQEIQDKTTKFFLKLKTTHAAGELFSDTLHYSCQKIAYECLQNLCRQIACKFWI